MVPPTFQNIRTLELIKQSRQQVNILCQAIDDYKAWSTLILSEISEGDEIPLPQKTILLSNQKQIEELNKLIKAAQANQKKLLDNLFYHTSLPAAMRLHIEPILAELNFKAPVKPSLITRIKNLLCNKK